MKKVALFINEISKDFKKDILKDVNTIQDNETIITSDTVFYLLVGKYISLNKTFEKYYDSFSTNIQLNIDEEITEVLTTKLEGIRKEFKV